MTFRKGSVGSMNFCDYYRLGGQPEQWLRFRISLSSISYKYGALMAGIPIITVFIERNKRYAPRRRIVQSKVYTVLSNQAQSKSSRMATKWNSESHKFGPMDFARSNPRHFAFFREMYVNAVYIIMWGFASWQFGETEEKGHQQWGSQFLSVVSTKVLDDWIAYREFTEMQGIGFSLRQWPQTLLRFWVDFMSHRTASFHW